MTESPDPDGAGPQAGASTIVKFDALGAAIESKIRYQDIPGQTAEMTTSAEYDNHGRVWKSIGAADADGHRPQIETAYNVDGTVKFAKELNVLPSGAETWRQTDFRYDRLGRNYFVETPEGQKTYQFFDGANDPVITVDANGLRSTVLYDRMNRPIQKRNEVITTPLGAETATIDTPVTRLTYYVNGKLWMEEQFKTSQFETISDNLLQSVARSYDPQGNLLAEVRDEGAPNAYPLTLDPADASIEYVYNSLGTIETVTDPNDYVTTYTTDSQGRIIGEMIDLNGNQILQRTFRYDSFGKLIQSIDRDDRTIQYGYNQIGSRISESWYNTGKNLEPGELDRTTVPRILTPESGFDRDYHATFTYSTLGEMKSAMGVSPENTSSYTFDYDVLRRPLAVSQTQSIVPGQQVYSTSYTSDLVGNVVGRTIGIGSGSSVTPFAVDTFAYDKQDRITNVTSIGSSNLSLPSPKSLTFGYGAAQGAAAGSTANLTSITRQNGANAVPGSTFTVNRDGRLRELSHELGSTTLFDQSQAYDSVGRVKQAKSTHDGMRGNDYDRQNRLTQTASGGSTPDSVFNYDAAGNRLPTASASVVAPYNRLESDGVNRYEEYDGEGNVIKRRTFREILNQEVTVQDEADLWLFGHPYLQVQATNPIEYSPGQYRFRLDPLELRFADDPKAVQIKVTIDSTNQPEFDVGTFTRVPTQVGDGVWRTQLGDLPFNVPTLLSGANVKILFTFVDLTQTPFSTEVLVLGKGHIEKLDNLYVYSWDYQNRLKSATAYDRPPGATEDRKLYTVSYVYDVLGNLVARQRDGENIPQMGLTYDDTKYFISENGKRTLEIDELGRVVRHDLYAPAVDQILAVDDFDDVPVEGGGTTVGRQTLWPLPDSEGNVAELYWSDAPTGTDPKLVKESIYYDSFDAPLGAVPDANESTLAEAVDARAHGWLWDADTETYLVGGLFYDPYAGRLLSENRRIQAGKNRYTLGGNNPDNLQSRASDYGAKKDNIGSFGQDYAILYDRLNGEGSFQELKYTWNDYVYYINPANDFQTTGDSYETAVNVAFGVGKVVGWTTAIVAGSGAVAIGATATAAGGISYTAAATYVGTQLAMSFVETAIETQMAEWMGEPYSVSDVGSAFLKNYMVNMATAGIGGKGNLAAKAAAFALRQSIEIAGDTAYDVAVQGKDLQTSLIVNSVGNLGGEAIGAVAKAGARRFIGAAADLMRPVTRGADQNAWLSPTWNRQIARLGQRQYDLTTFKSRMKRQGITVLTDQPASKAELDSISLTTHFLKSEPYEELIHVRQLRGEFDKAVKEIRNDISWTAPGYVGGGLG